MRVLVLHNAYARRGGEDEVVARESRLLAAAGLDTRVVIVANTQLEDPLRAIVTAVRLPYSRPARQRVASILEETAPDIVHLHNYFPLLTPSVLDACVDARVPVVHTLHNYRQFCSNGVLLRQGSQCQLCLHGSSLNAVRYKCYRGSRLGSLAVVRMIARHRRQQTWQTKVDRFIAPSPFSKDLLTAAGLPGDRIVVKPHFTPEPAALEPSGPRDYALYVGRLSVEKGIGSLMEAWRTASHELHVVGDGPLRDLVQSTTAINSRVRYLGQLDRDGVDREMRGAAYLVFPSILPETFGMTIVEAYAQGIPVLTSRLGSQAQLVADGVTGVHFEAGDASDLSQKAAWLWSNRRERREMGARGRREYEEKYAGQKNQELLLAVYEDVLAAREAKAPGRLAGRV